MNIINKNTKQIISDVENISIYPYTDYYKLSDEIVLIEPKYIKSFIFDETDFIYKHLNYKNVIGFVEMSEAEKLVFEQNISDINEFNEFNKGFFKYKKYIRTIVRQEFIRVGRKFKAYAENLFVDKPDYEVIQDENKIKHNITYLTYVGTKEGFVNTNGVLSNADSDIKVEQYQNAIITIEPDPRNKTNETDSIFIASLPE